MGAKIGTSALLVHIITLSLVGGQGNDTLVTYYENLIASQVAGVPDYVAPVDASIYEAADVVPQDIGNFDIIIVGAGSTGSVIASRLSEIEEWTVLLLEAGTFPNDFTMIPAYFALQVFTDYNWGFISTPQTTACLGAVEQRCPVPRGRGVGGTSLIDELVYSRGNAKDYDKWAEIVDDPSWSYENVLDYFKKSEDMHQTNPDAPIDWAYHGEGGLLNVDFHLPPNNLTKVFLTANQELGYHITDYNGRNQLGATILQLNTKEGRRLDQATAFVLPAFNRSNLMLAEESFVTKIEIDNTNTARGVIFTFQNQTFRATANKEVILSAGAISSPQLLMLSGIGPKSHLEELEIPVVQDLPVGSTLREHVFCGVLFSSNYTSASQTMEEIILDYLNGTGALAAANPIDGAGWYRTATEPIEDYPNLEMVLSSSSASEIGQRFVGWSDEIFQALFNISISNPFTLTSVLLHSKSTGTIRLKSNSPFDYPVIDYQLLSDPEDIDTLYQGIQIALALANTTAFQQIDAKLEVRQFAACAEYDFLSEAYWYCYLRQTSMAAYHPVGTCPSGTDPGAGAVVDSKFKVFGVNNLRVADASVFPFTLTGHPNAACTMIGEKISDDIKKEHGVWRPCK